MMIGVGIALMLNTGTSLISDLIGDDLKSAAFVYGSYSLLDNWCTGFVLLWFVSRYSKDPIALPWVAAGVPIITASGCAFFTWL